jgi:metallo-beta-lactamase class B
VGADDPQHGSTAAIPPATDIGTVADGETLTVGSIAVTAHFTPGHTAGGTSWTWQACEHGRCLNIVYADSISAVSAPNFRFTSNMVYPTAMVDFEKSFAVLARLPCDILVATHPEFSRLWDRLARREAGEPDALIDPGLCRAYVDFARQGFDKRIADEKGK